MYQNKLNHITFFFTFFKGYRYQLVICNNTKDNFLWKPEKTDFILHRNCANTSKISCIRFHFVKFKPFEFYFLGLQ